MKIQFCSDLHLEFPENRKFVARNPLDPGGDILVVAGDLVTFPEFEKASGFVDYASTHFSAVYWVPGNHEYYGTDIIDKPSPLLEKIRDNFYLVNNQSIVCQGIRLVFSTLWSRISPHLEWDIQRSISDFSAIGYRGGRFTSKLFSRLHEESLTFLTNTLQIQGGEPTVVVTHHVPTLMNYPNIYKNSPLTEAFAVELFDLIMDTQVACWIYGHHHVNTPDFTIGKTKILTNQLGYVHQREHRGFRKAALVEV